MIKQFGILLATALLCALPILAQDAGTAGLRGDVTDPSGAEIVATSSATGIGRTVTTNGTGLFTVNALAPVEYDVTISAKGLSPFTSQMRLEVGQQQDLKVRLQLKTEQINVKINSADTGPLVNTTSSIVDGAIGSQQIDALPLNGRNFLELSLLALLALTMLRSPRQALLGCAVVLLGLPVYALLRRSHMVPAADALPNS